MAETVKVVVWWIQSKFQHSFVNGPFSVNFSLFYFLYFRLVVLLTITDSHLSFYALSPRPCVCCARYDPACCFTRERHYGSQEFSFIVNWVVNCKFNRIGEPSHSPVYCYDAKQFISNLNNFNFKALLKLLFLECDLRDLSSQN